MNVERESYASEFIEGVRRYDRCDWCGRDVKRNRRGLCRSCDAVHRHLAAVENRISEVPAGSKDFILDWELRVAREMKKDCIAWGQILNSILTGPVESLGLEHWFRKLAESIARDKDMNFGIANILGAVFDAEQRQVLAYLCWKIFGKEASQKRRKRATWQAQVESLRARD
jgi:hypothetical protein